MRSLHSWREAEHLGSTAKAHHISVSGCQLGNLGALAQHISLYSQRCLSEQRVSHLLVHPNGVSCGDTCAIGFLMQPYQRNNSQPSQDNSCWDFTDTPDLFLEGPVCFQENLLPMPTFKCCQGSTESVCPSAGISFWAVKSLAMGAFSKMKCPMCLTQLQLLQ